MANESKSAADLYCAMAVDEIMPELVRSLCEQAGGLTRCTQRKCRRGRACQSGWRLGEPQCPVLTHAMRAQALYATAVAVEFALTHPFMPAVEDLSIE